MASTTSTDEQDVVYIPITTSPIKQAPIKAVTVYNDRAEVKREWNIDLVLGEQQFILQHFPTATMDETVRIVGSGPASVLEVSYQTIYEDIPNPDCKQKTEEEQQALREQWNKELDDLSEKRQALLSQKGQAQGVQSFLEKYRNSILYVDTGSHKQLDAMTQQQTLDSVKNFMGFYKTKLADFDMEDFKVKKAVDVLDKQMAEIRTKFNTELKPLKLSKKILQVSVLLQGFEASKAKLDVIYCVRNASWKAQYDVRVNPDNNIDLVYYAVITQNSEENWKNIKLSLSTAKPNNSSEPPKLPSMQLGYQAPSYSSFSKNSKQKDMSRSRRAEVEYYADECEDMEVGKAADMMMNEAIAPPAAQAYAQLAAPRAPQKPTMAVAASKAEQGTLSSTYHIEHPSSIPSDNLPHKVTIANIKLADCKQEYYSIPCVDTNAYLKVKAVNKSDYILFPGTVSVFFENNYVANTNLPNVNPGEEFEAFLSNDENVKVEVLNPQRFRQTKGVISTVKVEQVSLKTLVRNNKPLPIQMVIKDRLPMPVNNDIQVRLQDPHFQNKEPKDSKIEITNWPLLPKESKITSKVTMDVNTKQITWEFTVPANSKVIVPFLQEFEWPSGYELQLYEQ